MTDRRSSFPQVAEGGATVSIAVERGTTWFATS